MPRTMMTWLIAGGMCFSGVGAAAESFTAPTRLLSLGAPAPAFQLPDVVSGRVISLETFADKEALLVMMFCRHCPYVQHVKPEVAKLAKDYAGTSLGIVAISSNEIAAYPEDAPESLKQMAQETGLTFPFCYDATQVVGQAYTAVATPDFFLFDRSRKLVYRGQLDDSRPGNNKPLTGANLRAAIDAVLMGQPVNPIQKRSTGCSIKWKKGNEPAYLRH